MSVDVGLAYTSHETHNTPTRADIRGLLLLPRQVIEHYTSFNRSQGLGEADLRNKKVRLG